MKEEASVSLVVEQSLRQPGEISGSSSHESRLSPWLQEDRLIVRR